MSESVQDQLRAMLKKTEELESFPGELRLLRAVAEAAGKYVGLEVADDPEIVADGTALRPLWDALLALDAHAWKESTR